MASHYCHHDHPIPPPSTTCCGCNHHQPPLSPPPSTDQLLQVIASFLYQSDPVSAHAYHQWPKFHTQNHNHNHSLLNQNQCQQQKTHYSPISSLLHRIETLESSLQHFSSHSLNYHSSSFCSLRDTAARIIQTNFRAFLVRRSRTLRNLKDLAFIKSTFKSLKSTISNEAHLDFAAISRKAMDLLLKLDSIEGGDPLIRDGKRSISKDLIQFLDSIEGVALKKHLRYSKATKNVRVGQSVNKSRVRDSFYENLGNGKSNLLQNLRGRVERISRLCKVYADDDKDAEIEGVNHVADEDGGSKVPVSRMNEVTLTKNGVFVQPRVKKSVSFADNGNISKVYASTSEQPALEGSYSSDDMIELLEDISCEVENGMDSSQGDEGEGSPLHNSCDGERNSGDVTNDGRNEVNGHLQEHKDELRFSAPLPLKMESRADLKKSAKKV